MDKNFNLDNLDKKNIYPVPEDFFAQMQRNVFEKIEESAKEKEQETLVLVPEKKTNTRWYYAAAASFAALVCGLWMFGLKENPAQPDTLAVQQKVTAAAVPAQASAETPEAAYTADYYELLEAAPDMETTVAKPEKVQFANNQKAHQYVRSSSTARTTPPAEEIIGDLPIEEVRMLVNQSAPDVYLDLYQ